MWCWTGPSVSHHSSSTAAEAGAADAGCELAGSQTVDSQRSRDRGTSHTSSQTPHHDPLPPHTPQPQPQQLFTMSTKLPTVSLGCFTTATIGVQNGGRPPPWIFAIQIFNVRSS